MTTQDSTQTVASVLIELVGKDPSGLAGLFREAHKDLKRVAHNQRAHLQYNETLSTTALVNEAYIKLSSHLASEVQDRRHFLNIAASAMQKILIDHYRARIAAKRGSGENLSGLGDEDANKIIDEDAKEIERILALDQLIQELSQLEARLGELVKLRYFLGFSEEEAAAELGIARRTLQRDWQKAKAWLYSKLPKGL